MKYLFFCLALFACQTPGTQAVYPLVPNDPIVDYPEVYTCKPVDNSPYFCISFDTPNNLVDLSQSNIKDWIHWGLWSEVSVNRKANVDLIGNFTLVGTEKETHQYTDSHVFFSWNDGQPTQEMITTNGIFVYGKGNGFIVEAPASPEVNTLELYASSFGSDFELEAYVSDLSSPVFTYAILKPADELRVYKKLIFIYRAMNYNEKIVIKLINTKEYFPGAGSNIAIQGALLK